MRVHACYSKAIIDWYHTPCPLDMRFINDKLPLTLDLNCIHLMAAVYILHIYIPFLTRTPLDIRNTFTQAIPSVLFLWALSHKWIINQDLLMSLGWLRKVECRNTDVLLHEPYSSHFDHLIVHNLLSQFLLCHPVCE